MDYKSLPENEKKLIRTLLLDPSKMFALAEKDHDLFEKYEKMIFELAQPGGPPAAGG